ncbi:MAG: hypothetical protein ACRDDY_13225 [Clostridium sp.]|uniref:hypothetical protein n=1 Tax=Clostridium sp. TaxID=1506 RepID=UPI003EE577D0
MNYKKRLRNEMVELLGVSNTTSYSKLINMTGYQGTYSTFNKLGEQGKSLAEILSSKSAKGSIKSRLSDHLGIIDSMSMIELLEIGGFTGSMSEFYRRCGNGEDLGSILSNKVNKPKKISDQIREFMASHGKYMTVRECAKGMDMKVGTVSDALHKMKERNNFGYDMSVRKPATGSMKFRITANGEEKKAEYSPPPKTGVKFVKKSIPPEIVLNVRNPNWFIVKRFGNSAFQQA